MKKILIVSLLLFFCAVVPFPAQAATHEVMIGDDFFSPNDLTIQVGDTVNWSYSGSRFHDVTADDFSWNSDTNTSISFTRTFNSIEEILYHCTVHSIPGRNIDSNMNGRINVVAADEDPFLINGAISDAWFNPATSGQGFFIVVWEGINFVFLSWFTFDTQSPPPEVIALLGAPGQRWFTAQGPFTGDTATLDVFSSSGGIFDSATPEVENTKIGIITIRWTSCNSGILTYDIPSLGLMGDIPIERIVVDNVAACEAAQTAPALAADRVNYDE